MKKDSSNKSLGRSPPERRKSVHFGADIEVQSFNNQRKLTDDRKAKEPPKDLLELPTLNKMVSVPSPSQASTKRKNLRKAETFPIIEVDEFDDFSSHVGSPDIQPSPRRR